MPEVIHEFYAVTSEPVSIFKVTDLRNSEGFPIVECLGTRKSGSHPKGSKLRGGKLIALTRQGLVLYDDAYFHIQGDGPQKPSPFEKCGYSYNSERTGGIIGPFLKYEGAWNCFSSLRHRGLDPTWKAQTKEVLDRIGPDHPTFVISQSPVYSFIYDNPLD